ncbi:MAG: 3-deoxy-manno-octulosonate cytidylyltransferase [Alistipes sp.]
MATSRQTDDPHVYEKAHAFSPTVTWRATTNGSSAPSKDRRTGRYDLHEHRSGTDRCREALDRIEASTGKRFDAVVNIQGDEPFVAEEQLRLITGCFDDPATEIATLVKAFDAHEDIFNPNSPKVVLSTDGYALYFSRSAIPYLRGTERDRWQRSHKFLKHIGLYAYKSSVLRRIAELPQGTLEKLESLEQLRWLENGFRIKAAETHSESLAIDTPDDLKAAVEFLRRSEK